MTIKKILIKELLVFLDQVELKDLTKEEIEFLARCLSGIVVKVVPAKKETRLKIVKTG